RLVRTLPAGGRERARRGVPVRLPSGAHAQPTFVPVPAMSDDRQEPERDPGEELEPSGELEPGEERHPGEELAPGEELEPGEEDLADTLARDRPVPTAGFRGSLGRYLAEHDPGYGPRPEHLRATVAAWMGAGLVLVALGLLQATGS